MTSEHGVAGERLSADLVVLGAGVVGLSGAWRAAQAGLDVIVSPTAGRRAGERGRRRHDRARR